MSEERPIVDRAQLQKMTPAEIVEARRAGGLDLLTQGVGHPPRDCAQAGQWGAVIDNLTDDELRAAEAEGLLEPLHQQADTRDRASADDGARGDANQGAPAVSATRTRATGSARAPHPVP
jgi:hypothetical protein